MDTMENIIKTFPCGLRMIVRPMPNFKSVATSVHVGVGSRNEEKHEWGLSHFTEHMLFKGTTTRTAEQIAQTLSSLGVQYNAYTSNTATCYHTKGLLTNLDDCCDVLSDMYFNLKFTDEDFKRETGVILQEISMYEDQPRHVLHALCSETFFAGTTYAHPILGTAKSVKSFKPSHVHGFIKKHYTASNTIISFAGDITATQAEAMVKKYWLSKFKDKAKPNLPVKTDKTLNPPSGIAKRKKKIAQHNAAVLFPVPNFFHGDKYALTFIDGIFSDDMSSRLFTSVREKLGLVYAISGGFDVTDIGGFYYIWFSCTPDKTQTVLKTINSEIANLKANGVTEDEVQKVKNVLRARRLFKAENVERTNQRNVTQLSTHGEIETDAQYLSKIDKIKAGDVMAMANKYLDMDKAIICVVGKPFKNNLTI